MLDSTARAERIDLPSSEGPFYLWEVAQKPVSVRLPLAVVDRLESQTVETFRSLTARGSEIGGLLLGSMVPGNPALVTVTDFELIPCDYSRGPQYRLADADIARLEQAIQKHASGSGPVVVGYFRSHTRKGLSIDAEDVAFFEPRFVEPQQIVLLVRPFATKVSMAGIFIRENGRISGETSYQEFPFRSSELLTRPQRPEIRATCSPSTSACDAAQTLHAGADCTDCLAARSCAPRAGLCRTECPSRSRTDGSRSRRRRKSRRVRTAPGTARKRDRRRAECCRNAAAGAGQESQ